MFFKIKARNKSEHNCIIPKIDHVIVIYPYHNCTSEVANTSYKKTISWSRRQNPVEVKQSRHPEISSPHLKKMGISQETGSQVLY